MSKKNLLSESTIRKFMKFANIDALADNFLKEGSYMEEGEHDTMEEMAHPMEEEEDMDAPEADMDMDMDAPEADMDMDMDEPEDDMGDMGDMEPEGDSELPPEAVAALEQAVEAAVDSLLDALAPYGVKGDVEVEDETELPGDEGPVDSAVPMDAQDDEEVLDEEVVEEEATLDEEAIVNETLNRVTRRLREMSAQAKQAAEQDALVERIAEAVTRRLRK